MRKRECCGKRGSEREREREREREGGREREKGDEPREKLKLEE